MMMIMKYHEYNAADDDNNDYTSRDQMLLKNRKFLLTFQIFIRHSFNIATI